MNYEKDKADCHCSVFHLYSLCGVAKADAYLRGFEALEQKDYKTALYFLSMFAANGDARAIII